MEPWTMDDRLAMYDLIYALAADEGREKVLFGSCGPLAREAFQRSLIGEGFPLLWFEIPLNGEARFDLHVALSRNALCTGARFLPGAGNGYDKLFDWYEDEEPGGGGLAFAYDVSEGRIDDSAIHANVNNAPLSDMGRFFELAAGKDAAESYARFAKRLPEAWRVWYAGVHPGRPGSPVRVDCFVDSELKEAYAADLALLEHDLRASGFTAIGPTLRDLATPILESPFSLELQFDVMSESASRVELGPTIGISAGFPLTSAGIVRELFAEGEASAEQVVAEGGPGAVLMDKIERLGLADERWRLIPEASFSKLITVDGDALALYCAPTFIKLRMRDGKPLDAKLYLQASAAIVG